MAPYLERVKSFADVPVTDAGVDTVAFLEASEGVLGLFDLLGSAAFGPVQSDLKGNIEKVRTRYNATPTQSATLEQLVINEKGEKKRTATQGLLWLLRGLSFTCKALQNAQAKPETELTVAFTEAYGVTLRQYHSMLVRPIFSLAMKACPYKKDFYGRLAADPEGGAAVSDAKFDEELNKWLAALDTIVTRLQSFYLGGGHDKGF
ncbi:het-c2 protein [Trametopsis cervina]|nr:het-c2 protein [Trametopsis cervina]